MVSINYFSILTRFYCKIKDSYKKFYRDSNLYNKKISKTFNNQFIYKPSAYLLSSIIKYQKKKYKIENFAIETIWQNSINSVSYTHLRAHETDSYLVCRLLLEKKIRLGDGLGP